MTNNWRPASAKDLMLRPIDSRTARACVRRIHYSHTVVNNSQLHIGAYWNGRLEGCLQFGPPLDKRKILPLVNGSEWPNVLELNRMAFSAALPRNSESVAIGLACRVLRRYAPQVKWIVTFADATQCGDGTIYRASGFLLTGIRRNKTVWSLDGEVITEVAWKHVSKQRRFVSRVTLTKGKHVQTDGAASMKALQAAGAKPLPGFQVRYVKFLDPSWRAQLVVPVLPYSAIDEAGARMYRGRGADSGAAGPPAGGGANPTRPLHPEGATE